MTKTEPSKASTASELDIAVPDWVPKIVGDVARRIYADTFPNKAFPEFFACSQAIAHLVSDRRMRDVFKEFIRKRGHSSRGIDFAHPVRTTLVSDLEFGFIKDLLPPGGPIVGELLQHYGYAVLLCQAARFFLWRQDFSHGPRARTKMEVNDEVHQYNNRALQLRDYASRISKLGLGSQVPTIEAAAVECEKQARARMPLPNDPFVIGRHSRRLPLTNWERGFLIYLGQQIQLIFGHGHFRRSVATLANVVLGTNLKESAVQRLLARRRT